MGARREISGNDLLLFIDPAGGTNFILIVCLNSNSIERTTNEIDAGSKCGPSLLPGVRTIKVNFEFIDVLDTTNMEVSESALHPLWQASTIISWKFGKVTPVAGDVTYTGVGFISSLSLTAAKNNPVTTTGTIAVQGDINQTVTGS